tara:strand:+ start:8377 stop:8859 length:483 start_codon:yes stop_codon:yes gene_type:complete
MNKNIKINLNNKNNYINGKILDFNNFKILEEIIKKSNDNLKFSNFLINEIKENYNLVAIIEEINVEEKDRNKGKGHELIEKFLKKSEEFCVDFIIVISDEDNSYYKSKISNNDFSIRDFYEHFGFITIRKLSHNKDVLIYPSEVAEDLIDVLKENKEKLF